MEQTIYNTSAYGYIFSLVEDESILNYAVALKYIL